MFRGELRVLMRVVCSAGGEIIVDATHCGIRRVHWLPVAALHYVHAQDVTLFHRKSRRVSVHNRGVERAQTHVTRLRGDATVVSVRTIR